MRYKAIIETDDFDDFEFFEDGNGKYIHGIDAGAVNNEWIALYFTECEQEPVLDRIRAEIWDLQYGDEEKSMTDENRADAYNNAISQAIEIIDKYKAESGDKTE